MIKSIDFIFKVVICMLPVLFWYNSLTFASQSAKNEKLTNQLDSIKLFLNKNPNQVIKAANEISTKAMSLNDTLLLANSIYVQGLAYSKIGKSNKADSLYLIAHQYFKQIESPRGIGNVEYSMAVIRIGRGEMDEARNLMSKAMSRYEEINYHVGISKIYNGLAVQAKFNHDFDSSLYYFNQALIYSKNERNIKLKWSLKHNIVSVLFEQKKYFKAMEESLKLLDLSDSIPDLFYKAKIENLISSIYHRIGDINEAKEHLNKSVDLAKNIENERLLTDLHISLGSIYNDEPDSSLFHFMEALIYTEKMGVNEKLSNLYNLISKTYASKADYQNSNYYGAKSLQTARNAKNTYHETLALLRLSQNYRLQGQLDQALTYALEGEKLIKLHSFDKLKSRLYLVLYNIYNEKDMPYKALKAVEHVVKGINVIEDREVVKRMAMFEARHNYESEKQKILLEKHKAELELSNKLQKQETLKYSAFIALTVFVILSIILFSIYRIRKKDNSLLEQKNMEVNRQSAELIIKNRELQELSKYKEGLTNMIAHDMKNPLNAVIGLTEEPPDQNRLKQIRQSGWLMSQMISNMLDVQKFENTNVKLELGNYHLNELIGKAQSRVNLLLVSNGIFFVNLVNPSLCVKVDSDLIIRVFINLITNAIKYSRTGEDVTISAIEIDNRVRISISDSGQGIDDSALPHIFNKFYQNDAKKSGKMNSSGLGLTFCKMTIEAHHGDILVNSKIGEGTTFSFDLERGDMEEHQEWAHDPLSMHPNKLFALSEKNWSEIELIAIKIKSTPLYNVSSIYNALEELDDSASEIKEWKLQVKNAVLNWDRDNFDKLLSRPQF